MGDSSAETLISRQREVIVSRQEHVVEEEKNNNLTRSRGRRKNCAFFRESNYRGSRTPYKEMIAEKKQKEKTNLVYEGCCGCENPRSSKLRNLVFYGCNQCKKGDITWRCGGCYDAIQRAALYKMGEDATIIYDDGGLHFISCFFQTNFTDPEKNPAASREIITSPTDLEKKEDTYPRKRNADGEIIYRKGIRLLMWKDGCIHCKDWIFPTIPKKVLNHNSQVIQTAQPTPTYMRLDDVFVLDINGTVVELKSVGILIYTIRKIMTDEEALLFKGYYANDVIPGMGKRILRYKLIYDTSRYWQQFETDETTKTEQHWVIVRTAGVYSDILSMKHENGLEGNYGKKRKQASAISKGVLTVTRIGASTSNEFDNSKHRVKLPIMIKRGWLRSSGWRSNRRGGSSGHTSGSSMATLRKNVCSPYLFGQTPFNVMSCVVLPTRRKDNVWTEMTAFYFRVTPNSDEWIQQNEETTTKNGVCASPMTALPRRGWLTNGKHIISTLNNKSKDTTNDLEGLESNYLMKMVSGNCSAAMILHQVARINPSLACSQKAMKATFANMLHVCKSDTEKCERVKDLIDKLHCGQQFSTMDLMETSEFSTLIDAVAGHADHYNSDKKKDSELESKVTLAMGQPNKSMSIDGYEQSGSVPPGFLAYPQYGIATVCYANKDIEFHDLSTTKVIHAMAINDGNGVTETRNAASVDNPVPNEDNDEVHARGAWAGDESGNLNFYPQGAAVTQYEKKNRQQQIHQQQRTRARVRRRNRNRNRDRTEGNST